eukprot:6854962-Karenia_brevis.AAC.1
MKEKQETEKLPQEKRVEFEPSGPFGEGRTDQHEWSSFNTLVSNTDPRHYGSVGPVPGSSRPSSSAAG